jgi:hypothetical protein
VTAPDPVAYWLAQLAKAERAADYARAQLAAARAREEQP